MTFAMQRMKAFGLNAVLEQHPDKELQLYTIKEG